MSPHALNPAQAEATKKLITGIWLRHQMQILSRLELLECAASAVAAENLTSPLLQEALSISHNLAGSLGMFGFGEGTVLARMLEEQLESEKPNAREILLVVGKLREILFPETPVGAVRLVASH